MRNFSTSERNILADLDIDLDRGRLSDRSPEPARSPRRGGILPDLDISMSDNGQMVVNDDRISNDPAASDPYSAQGRKPARPGGEFDADAMLRQCVASASHPGEAIEQLGRALEALRRQYGVARMSLNVNPKGVWSGGFGRAYGRVTAMGLADNRDRRKRMSGWKNFAARRSIAAMTSSRSWNPSWTILTPT